MEILSGAQAELAEQWMYKAAQVATQAKCLRALCGAVIIQEWEIIGKGYNSPPLDCTLEHCDKKERPEGFKSDASCCVHAEQRAIDDALRTHSDKLKGSTLYFTRVHPDGTILAAWKPFCTICSKAALDKWIAQFVLRHAQGITTYDTKEYNDLSFAYNGEE